MHSLEAAMVYASDLAPIPGQDAQPIGPGFDPAPAESPPEIMPDSSPSEAPVAPAFPDDGRSYD